MVLLDHTKADTQAHPRKRDVLDWNLIVKLSSMLSNGGYLYLRLIKPLSDRERGSPERDKKSFLTLCFPTSVYIGTRPLTVRGPKSQDRYVFIKNPVDRVWLSYRNDGLTIVTRAQIDNYVTKSWRIWLIRIIALRSWSKSSLWLPILSLSQTRSTGFLNSQPHDNEPPTSEIWALYQNRFLDILKTSSDSNQVNKYRYKIMAYLAAPN